MAITLLDNSNTIFNSYQRGWELALKIYEEETDKFVRSRSTKKKNS